ncbi:MAG: serine hydrolase domain-containing protein [Xanthobacteraceae bacterium]
MRPAPSRRQILQGTTKVAARAAFGIAGVGRSLGAPADSRPNGTVSSLDSMLREATSAHELPGIVALAASETDLVYEGVFGSRRLPDGPPMTRDTVFRIASMVKLITSVAAMQIVEQNKLSLDAPVPGLDPVLRSPRVLEGFDARGRALLRPPKRPILLRHLLTHTAGFTYRLWDAKAVQYLKSLDLLSPVEKKQAPRTPLMFDPGDRWQYGTSLDWVGRIVEAVSGERLDVYFRRHILDPLGMSDTTFVLSPQQRRREASMHQREAKALLVAQPVERQDPERKSFSGGGGIYSTAPDYLRLLRALLRGGSLDGARILRPETVALMGQNQIGDIEAGVLRTTAPAASNDVDFFPRINLRWGFGHMINMQPVPAGRAAGSLTWAGLFNTYYWIDPARHLAAVFMTQVLPFADRRSLRIHGQFERSLYAALP